ncbi:MAG: Qat anti-phage system QueC-like protein QatC [Polyangiaceae bacterium]
MKWHVILRVGAGDTYAKELPAGTPRMFVSLDAGNDLFLLRQNVLKQIRDRLGRVPPAAAMDLLVIAMAVFAADLRILRTWAEDRWSRDIVLHVPVFGVAQWRGLGASLVEMLNFLTGDTWHLEFRERAPLPPDQAKPAKDPPEIHDVALFSGGLDSLAGAIDLLESGRRVALTGHYGAGVTNSVQQEVLSALEAHYADRVVPCMFHVQALKRETDGESRPNGEAEQSMRSRSFLFLTLGIAVATALGSDRRLVVSENGFISLNVPLVNPRIGSCSTRTTHPHFIASFRELLRELQLGSSVELPGRFRTKGEMLREVRNQTLLRSIAPNSMSCSHPEQGRYRKLTPGNHCGYCVPCIVRRAAMAAASLPDAAYDTDILSPEVELTHDTRKDLRAFEIAVTKRRRQTEQSAVFDVLSSGPLPPEEVRQYAAVYQRGMEEVARLLTTRGSALSV